MVRVHCTARYRWHQTSKLSTLHPAILRRRHSVLLSAIICVVAAGGGTVEILFYHYVFGFIWLPGCRGIETIPDKHLPKERHSTFGVVIIPSASILLSGKIVGHGYESKASLLTTF
jgi:hypothetical protein